MTRLSKYLFVAAALVAAPVSTAFAQDEPTGEEGGVEGGVEGGGLEAEVGAEGTGETPVEAPVAETGMSGMWSRAVIDRPLTLNKGKIGAQLDLGILRISETVLGVTSSATVTGLQIGGAYGITDKISAGLLYAFSLDPFEIEGPVTLYGAMGLVNDAKLTVGASADFEINFAQDTSLALNAGLGVRYKVAPKIAIISGTPWTPGTLGRHLHIGIDGDEDITFSLPAGVGFQATPELFAYLNTNLFTISLSDPGMDVSRFSSYNDRIPVELGAFYSVTPNIDAAVALGFGDLPEAGDTFAITLGGRYFTN